MCAQVVCCVSKSMCVNVGVCWGHQVLTAVQLGAPQRRFPPSPPWEGPLRQGPAFPEEVPFPGFHKGTIRALPQTSSPPVWAPRWRWALPQPLPHQPGPLASNDPQNRPHCSAPSACATPPSWSELRLRRPKAHPSLPAGHSLTSTPSHLCCGRPVIQRPPEGGLAGTAPT